eukprot:CAMPEP_0116880388 /NCGR_PEP_ID=MMETSP0463-20121206/12311_1 /TAXON_ID=181622 /ORGANISM="Strombidinopsis sp, Strain SopsisLIS2011" /LENGTH=65 /DNA_ID=CAMNT_0004530905 /DNA_START=564 /DNA_END=758 /DNA_ORIENTATION=-
MTLKEFLELMETKIDFSVVGEEDKVVDEFLLAMDTVLPGFYSKTLDRLKILEMTPYEHRQAQKKK